MPQITPKNVTISRTADKWFISFKIELEPSVTPKMVDIVGVDLGVKTLATLSTGEVFEGAKSYRKYESLLSRLQWLNRHKEIGSANWSSAQIKIARVASKDCQYSQRYITQTHYLPCQKPRHGCN